MSNIIILSLLGLGIITSFSFIFAVKSELTFSESVKIEGSQNLANKAVEIGVFHSINVHDQIKIVLRQGESNVEITAEDNLIAMVVIENNDGILEVYKESKEPHSQNSPMIVNISNPEFQAIHAREQSDVYIEDGLILDKLEIEMRDQSSFNGKLEIGDLILKLSQQSNAQLRGNCNTIDFSGSDQSGVRASGFMIKEAKIGLSQQAEAKFDVTEAIDARINDNARLQIKNNPSKSKVRQSQQARFKSN